VFPINLPVTSPGNACNSHNAFSVEVFGMTCISFYGTQCPKDTFGILADTLARAAATGLTYVRIGDLNIRNEAMRTWLLEQNCAVQVLDSGHTCTTAKGTSDIDYAILSPLAARFLSRHFPQQASLETHKALHVEFVSQGMDPDFAYTVWDKVIPTRGQATQPFLAHGLMADSWQRQWGVMQQLLPSPPKEAVTALHQQWLRWMQTELGANRSVNVSPQRGAAFAFRTTTPLPSKRMDTRRSAPCKLTGPGSGVPKCCGSY
jgi:hypothetical protein